MGRRAHMRSKPTTRTHTQQGLHVCIEEARACETRTHAHAEHEVVNSHALANSQSCDKRDSYLKLDSRKPKAQRGNYFEASKLHKSF